MSWLLDTDVICQPAKRKGDARVIAWLEAEQDRCYTSAVVVAQLAYRVGTREGRQRLALQAWLTRLVDALQGRTTHARRRQLHRRNRPKARPDDSDGQR
jgi:predicted nucleic acid-binding protein